MNKFNTLTELVEKVGEITTPNSQKATLVGNNLINQIKNYVKANGMKSLVVGISGGLDSAVIAALCQSKNTGVPLIGISIPMSSSTAHKEQAQWVGDTYCDAFQEFKGWDESWDLDGEAGANGATTNMLSEVLNTVSQTDAIAKEAGFDPETFPKSVLDGNIKARLRMITLMDMSRKCDGLVVSTDNLSEFNTGFWTLFGDVGTFSPIQQIGKGFELPEIAKALGIREDIITQPPSDGLMVTDDDTDEAQLGANYKEVDTILSIYLGTLPIPDERKSQFKSKMFNLIETDIDGAKKVAKVISRYEKMTFKRRGIVELQRTQIGLS